MDICSVVGQDEKVLEGLVAPNFGDLTRAHWASLDLRVSLAGKVESRQG